MTRWLWSVALSGLGLIGLCLAGRRSYWGWVLGLCDEALWVAYAIHSRQWAFGVSALAYSWVYARNLCAWRRDANVRRRPGRTGSRARRTGGAAAAGDAPPCPGTGAGAGLAAPGGGLLRFGGLVVAAGLLLSGCVGVVGGPSPSGTAVSGRPGAGTVSPAELADFAVRQAYEEFWWVAARIDAQPPQRWPGVLSQVSADPELSRQLAQARDRAGRGVHRYGEVVSHIGAVRGALSVRATVIDCQDASGFGEAENGAGRPVAAGRSGTPVTATLIRDGGFAPWRVSDIGFLGGRCDGAGLTGRPTLARAALAGPSGRDDRTRRRQR